MSGSAPVKLSLTNLGVINSTLFVKIVVSVSLRFLLIKENVVSLRVCLLVKDITPSFSKCQPSNVKIEQLPSQDQNLF